MLQQVCTDLQSQSGDSVMVIKLVHLLSLISIASTTVVSRSNSQGECPVWFKRNENKSCECGSELGGEIRCDPYKQVVSIMVGYCMSFDNSSQELVVGFNNDRCLGRSMNSHPRGFSHIYRSLSTDITKLEDLCSVTTQNCFVENVGESMALLLTLYVLHLLTATCLMLS